MLVLRHLRSSLPFGPGINPAVEVSEKLVETWCMSCEKRTRPVRPIGFDQCHRKKEKNPNRCSRLCAIMGNAAVSGLPMRLTLSSP